MAKSNGTRKRGRREIAPLREAWGIGYRKGLIDGYWRGFVIGGLLGWAVGALVLWLL